MTTIQAGGLHYVQLARAAAQSIATGAAFTAIDFDTEVFKNGIVVTLANAEECAIARTGLYQVEAFWGLALASGQTIALIVNKNGSAILSARDHASASSGCFAIVCGTVMLTAGDTIGLTVTQTTAGAQNTLTAVNARPTLTITEVR